MKTVVWVAAGLIAMSLCAALGSRLQFGHIVPDAAVITVVFVALRREPIREIERYRRPSKLKA